MLLIIFSVYVVVFCLVCDGFIYLMFLLGCWQMMLIFLFVVFLKSRNGEFVVFSFRDVMFIVIVWILLGFFVIIIGFGELFVVGRLLFLLLLEKLLCIFLRMMKGRFLLGSLDLLLVWWFFSLCLQWCNCFFSLIMVLFVVLQVLFVLLWVWSIMLDGRCKEQLI